MNFIVLHVSASGELAGFSVHEINSIFRLEGNYKSARGFDHRRHDIHDGSYGQCRVCPYLNS